MPLIDFSSHETVTCNHVASVVSFSATVEENFIFKTFAVFFFPSVCCTLNGLMHVKVKNVKVCTNRKKLLFPTENPAPETPQQSVTL